MTPNNLKPKLNLLIKKPTSTIFGSKKTETKSPQGFSSLSELMASHKSKSTSEKPKFSSLSGLISNHASAKDDKDGDKKSFGSLAEMTAHHLKSTSPFKKSNKNSFVIPKLSNKVMASSSINLPGKLIKSVDESDTSRSSDVDKVSLDVKNLQLDNNCEDRDKDKDDDKNKDKESNWEIDLTKALRQPGSPAVISSKTKLSNGQDLDIKSQDNFDLKKLYDNINEPICSSIVVDSIEVLECNLTLINLKYAELHHFNKMASPFGKMLCRKWKSKKPYVKKSKCEFSDKIKPFDFSSPSPDSLILANLRR